MNILKHHEMHMPFALLWAAFGATAMFVSVIIRNILIRGEYGVLDIIALMLWGGMFLAYTIGTFLYMRTQWHKIIARQVKRHIELT